MEEIKKPSWFLYLTEFPRALYDLVQCLIFVLFHKPNKNINGNGQPVLVLPGLLGTDFSTKILRRFLEKYNYKSYPWGLGRNLGDLNQIDILCTKLNEIATEHKQKVMIIGHSLGGIYAREVAKKTEPNVAMVVTLGSPFANVAAPNHAMWVFSFFNDATKIDKTWWDQIPEPANVPGYAFYSKSDGIVQWKACQEIENNLHKNMEVTGSHFGFCNNAEVLQCFESSILNKLTP